MPDFTTRRIVLAATLAALAGCDKLGIPGQDKPAFRVQLEAWSRIEDLNRILVSHGEVIDRDPRAVLRTLAKSLMP